MIQISISNSIKGFTRKILGIFFRITENGVHRITEDGKRRIKE
jgi:hypothetical protein